ncbi:hypothetical protein J6590_006832 [Homalodisca vitripennis]|nr:hypothetical protein J6590_006832 [Homalodisca vitripennis]
MSVQLRERPRDCLLSGDQYLSVVSQSLAGRAAVVSPASTAVSSVASVLCTRSYPSVYSSLWSLEFSLITKFLLPVSETALSQLSTIKWILVEQWSILSYVPNCL